MDTVDRPSLSTRRAAVELVIVSFVVLFQELAFIRWLPAWNEGGPTTQGRRRRLCFADGGGPRKGRTAPILWTRGDHSSPEEGDSCQD